MTDIAAGVPPRHRLSRGEWRVIILSSLGGALEFYDFVIYSMFAQYIGASFFPAQDPFVSLMLSYAVFAVGYLARPIGGIILSHFGDRYGRRRVFIATILIMSSSTAAMGLLPTYGQIGVTASLLMILLRLIQGFCLGGELPGAITYVVENAPRHAGFAAGMIFFCVNTGVGLASILSLVVHEVLRPEQVAGWGWRLGFLFGGICGFGSFWLRLSLEETQAFTALRNQTSKRPFVELVQSRPMAMIVGVGALVATGGFNGLLFAMPTLLPAIMDYSAVEAAVAQSILLGVLSAGLIVFAWLGDRIPRHYLLGGGTLVAILSSHAWFVAADKHSIPLPLLAAIAGFVASIFGGVFAGIVADLFPTRLRFSGVAVSFNIAFSVSSGIAALVATALVKTTGDPTAASWYMVACAGLAFVASLFVPRYAGHIGRD